MAKAKREDKATRTERETDEAAKRVHDDAVVAGALGMLALLGEKANKTTTIFDALVESAIDADRPLLVKKLGEISLEHGFGGFLAGGQALKNVEGRATVAVAPKCLTYLSELASKRRAIEKQAQDARAAMAKRMRSMGLALDTQTSASGNALSEEDSALLLAGHVDKPDKRLRYPLMVAASHGMHALAEEMLVAGARPGVGDANAVTSLMMASRRGDEKMVRLLLAHGAEVEARDYRGATAAHYACSGPVDNPEALLALASAGAVLEGNPSDKPREYRPSPLHAAAWEGHALIVNTLLDLGAKIDSRLPDGSTPLMRAAMRGHEQIMVALVKADASVDLVDNEKRSAFDWAIQSNRPLAHETRDMLMRLPYELEAKQGEAGARRMRI